MRKIHQRPRTGTAPVRLSEAVNRLDDAERARLLDEIERTLRGRTRDIVLSHSLHDLYLETSWRQRSRIACSWLGWSSLASVGLGGLHAILRGRLFEESLVMLAIFIPVIYAALAYVWSRPRAPWIEGLTAPIAIVGLMAAGGVLGLQAGGLSLHDNLGVVLFASTTAIVIFPITLTWTIAGAVGAIGTYVGFGLFDPVLQIKEILLHATALAVVTGCLIPARNSMNVVLQQAFLLTLKGLLQSRALETANERLAILANTDGLTGLPNRRAFEDTAARLWVQSGASTSNIGIVMLDIDHFKRLNDTSGHAAGDRCLATVAGAIRAGVSDRGMAARYGGEEFICIVTDATPRGLHGLAEALRASIQAMAYSNPGLGAGGIVTVSVGSALGPSDGCPEGLAELIHRADAALYQAKRSGRNCSVSAATEPDEPRPAPRSADGHRLCA